MVRARVAFSSSLMVAGAPCNCLVSESISSFNRWRLIVCGSYFFWMSVTVFWPSWCAAAASANSIMAIFAGTACGGGGAVSLVAGAVACARPAIGSIPAAKAETSASLRFIGSGVLSLQISRRERKPSAGATLQTLSGLTLCLPRRSPEEVGDCGKLLAVCHPRTIDVKRAPAGARGLAKDLVHYRARWRHGQSRSLPKYGAHPSVFCDEAGVKWRVAFDFAHFCRVSAYASLALQLQYR